jgi:hypothetical protein
MDSEVKTEKQTLDMRFLSIGKTAYKVHIHMPDDSVIHKSVGFIKQGKEAGYKSAIKLRNELGSAAWGKHWKRILSDPKIFNRLPKNLEPILYTNPKNGTQYYRAMPVINGKRICAKRSVEKYGKLGAYLACKKILLEAYERDLELLSYMGRLPTIYLK